MTTNAIWLMAILVLLFPGSAIGAGTGHGDFPPPLNSYAPSAGSSLWDVLQQRIQAEPFNLVATIMFVLAVIHTFLAPMFMRLAHRFQHAHEARMKREGKVAGAHGHGEVSFKAEVFHFLGEVEAIFGIWVLPLLIGVTINKGWATARDYVGHGVNFTEPMFVVVIMAMASSRPVLRISEQLMSMVASLGGKTPAAWWLSILTVGPLLGSFITEPAAMTISALLLAERFYRLKPSKRFAYATIGLLFVNVSVGGTLTHFAAPPVLMVAGKWGWGMDYMLLHFGWKAAVGIVAANLTYFAFFRRELKGMLAAQRTAATGKSSSGGTEPIPIWITGVHLAFLAWTVMNNHFPVLFVGGFLFYLAFTRATEQHQESLRLRPALLVGFFLAGLVIHGGLQGWWIEPVLTRLNDRTLFFGAMLLTAFNDNAAITYLASLVPGFSEQLKYAVVAGAVVGGGLTVIANAPNPAGQSILSKYFINGVSALGLFLGALIPTLIIAIAFLLFPSF